MVGARLADKLTSRFGARIVVGAGLALIAVALFAGARTGVDTGYGYVAAWVALAGIGLGFTLPPSMNAALAALTPERSGVGSGLIQAMRQVGSAIGVAVLGTVLNSGYRDEIDAAGLPDAARDSAAAGVTLARRAGDPGMLETVRHAFTHGMDVALVTTGAVAAAGVLLVVILPRHVRRPATAPGEVVLAESGV